MKRENMIKLLSEGKDPLDLSIQKWQDIVNNKGNDKDNDENEYSHSENCALCYTYLKNGGCGACPVGQKKGYYCNNTPYYDWCECGDDPQFYEHPAKDSLKYAKKELAFLKRLKVSVEAKPKTEGTQ